MKNIIDNSIKIVKESGDILSDYFYKNKEGKLSFNVDKKMEKYIIERLKKKFPNFQIISEEKYNKKLQSEYIWVLDPIDGTYNFDNGHEEFSISLGLLHNFKPIFGIVYNPIKKILYFGETDKKSFVIKDSIKKEISVSDTLSTKNLDLVISHAYKNDYRNEVTKSFSKKINYTGSASLRICHVARGINDINITLNHSLKLWDICASYAIISGANGLMTDFKGTNLFDKPIKELKNYSNFMCSNKTINAESTKKLQKILNKKIVEDNYNIKVKSQKKINLGYINNVTIINTDKKKYVLKKFEQANENDIKYEINIIDLLVKNKIKTSLIVSDKDGGQYNKFGDFYYVLFEYLESSSQSIASPECAKLYSEYHNAIKKLGNIKRENWLTLCDCKWIKNKNNKENFPELLDYLVFYEKKLSKIYTNLPKIIIHGDLKKDNIIKTKKGLHLIDFGNSRVEARCLDIAHIADSLDGKTFCIDKLTSFLNDLREYMKLNKTERESMIYLLIIHKITETFFYNKKNERKRKSILKDIKMLIKNEKEFIEKLIKLY